MSLVAEFGSQQGSAASSIAVTPPAAIAVGRLVVAAVMVYKATAGAVTGLTDAQGNTWTLSATATTSSSSTRVFLAWTVVTTAITGAITAAFSTSQDRSALALAVFDDAVTGALEGAMTADIDSSTVASAALTTTSADTLVVVGVGFVNSGRTLSAVGGMTAGTKQATATSSNRAVQLVWGWRASPGSGAVGGTLDSSGSSRLVGLALVRGTPDTGPEVGILHGWTGSGWVPVQGWNGTAWADVHGADAAGWH